LEHEPAFHIISSLPCVLIMLNCSPKGNKHLCGRQVEALCRSVEHPEQRPMIPCWVCCFTLKAGDDDDDDDDENTENPMPKNQTLDVCPLRIED